VLVTLSFCFSLLIPTRGKLYNSCVTHLYLIVAHDKSFRRPLYTSWNYRVSRGDIGEFVVSFGVTVCNLSLRYNDISEELDVWFFLVETRPLVSLCCLSLPYLYHFSLCKSRFYPEDGGGTDILCILSNVRLLVFNFLAHTHRPLHWPLFRAPLRPPTPRHEQRSVTTKLWVNDPAGT
jgi:hypothetical protein